MQFKARPQSNTFSKLRRPFGEPVSPIKPNPAFKAIPSNHVQPDDLTYDVSNVLTPEQITAISNAKKLVFHCVGDTGGIDGTDIQDELASQMEDQIRHAGTGEAPSFFYHFGDVVYFNGESGDYKPQFYDPYQSYPAPIFAIPGNHDGDNRVRPGDAPDDEQSLTGFFQNFCAPQRTPSPDSPYRYLMDQPWPYWTLKAPYVTIIGLYSNVDGSLDPTGSNSHNQPQYNWFVDQLQAVTYLPQRRTYAFKPKNSPHEAFCGLFGGFWWYSPPRRMAYYSGGCSPSNKADDIHQRWVQAIRRSRSILHISPPETPPAPKNIVTPVENMLKNK